jgi:hypothetical protein
MLSHSSCVFFLQLLSQGSTYVPALLVEVTRAREATAAVQATHVPTMLAAETSAREAATEKARKAANQGKEQRKAQNQKTQHSP